MIIRSLIIPIVIIASILTITIYSLPAFGFVVLPKVSNNDDIANELLIAARWTNVSKSLVNQNFRGLGGGIEYAIAPSFCSQILPRFIDRPQPSCEEIQQSIQQTFDIWAQGHPILKFVNVSSLIKTQLDKTLFNLEKNTDRQQFFGAEIDLFALSQEVIFIPFRGIAYTYSAFSLREKPFSTNNHQIDGGTIMSADIIFNLGKCYYLTNDSANQFCNHFTTVLLHEIGHALGLDHPDENRLHNFDTDNNPKNEIVINCQNQLQGLKPSQNIDPQAVMNSKLEEAAPIKLALSFDDLGGRDFLYPICIAGKDKYPIQWQFLVIWIGGILSIVLAAYKYERYISRKRTKIY
ncbi:MAG TPA: hypothetical protein DCY88_26740 [Cyanobacteria bacterium UBA11372]|nr:hypothetical protein [Cyanobacteria bacterium UBA11372]